MKSTRTKIIIGLVALLTAGSLFAFKGKMMHHRKAKMEECYKQQSDGDVKNNDHRGHNKFDGNKESVD